MKSIRVMMHYKYWISARAHYKVLSFYENVAEKFFNTYSEELQQKNVDEAIDSMYRIEKDLLRRKPTIARWKGLHMAHGGKWYYAYRIDGDTIYIEDACHQQNMHELEDA